MTNNNQHNSIETFMNIFFPEREKLASLEWILATFSPKGRGEDDYIRILVDRRQPGSWRVKLGDIEAMISMWMASAELSIEKRRDEAAKRDQSEQTQETKEDWRRTKAQLGSKYKYCRVLGDDSDERRLKRDLSWLVDELIAEESDESRSHTKFQEADIAIGFNGGKG